MLNVCNAACGHRMAWVGMIKIIQLESSCCRQGCHKLDQAAQGPIHSGLEQGMGHPQLLWATCSSTSTLSNEYICFDTYYSCSFFCLFACQMNTVLNSMLIFSKYFYNKINVLILLLILLSSCTCKAQLFHLYMSYFCWCLPSVITKTKLINKTLKQNYFQNHFLKISVLKKIIFCFHFSQFLPI